MSSDRTSAEAGNASSDPFVYLTSEEEAQQASRAVGDPANWASRGEAAAAKTERHDSEVFERGSVEGQSHAKVEFDKQVDAQRLAIGGALAAFKGQREIYFHRVEAEVVQLSLAIARKILHREIQMDPLLLAGLVHVALDKLESGTHVRLRANPADIHFWTEYFAQPDSFQPSPELIGDANLKRGECALEGEMGTTQVSIETQLKEIEQGFFDLLEQRPRIG